MIGERGGCGVQGKLLPHRGKGGSGSEEKYTGHLSLRVGGREIGSWKGKLSWSPPECRKEMTSECRKEKTPERRGRRNRAVLPNAERRRSLSLSSKDSGRAWKSVPGQKMGSASWFRAAPTEGWPKKIQTFSRLPPHLALPLHIQPRVVSLHNAVGFPKMMCVGKPKFALPSNELSTAGLFFWAPPWLSDVSRGHDQAAEYSVVWTVDPIDAISKLDMSEDGAAVMRSWWPLAELTWSPSDPEGFGPRAPLCGTFSSCMRYRAFTASSCFDRILWLTAPRRTSPCQLYSRTQLKGRGPTRWRRRGNGKSLAEAVRKRAMEKDR